MDSPAAGAGDWPARLPWWPAVWWLAAANSEGVEREREQVGRRERENGKLNGFFWFLKTYFTKLQFCPYVS